jgi:hypothetical protein
MERTALPAASESGSAAVLVLVLVLMSILW